MWYQSVAGTPLHIGLQGTCQADALARYSNRNGDDKAEG
jgi:hypothetical protein